MERINFNDGTFAGYLLGAEDYLVSRLDPTNRDAGGVNLSASTANNFIVGEQGVNDEITGGSGNDLIFGGTGDNTLNGGAGDDLLVGGSGAGDNDVLDGGLDADTMVGLAGNDTYIVDDVADVVVEAAAAGTDEVQTEMAAYSLELVANVENLTYTGHRRRPVRRHRQRAQQRHQRRRPGRHAERARRQRHAQWRHRCRHARSAATATTRSMAATTTTC